MIDDECDDDEVVPPHPRDVVSDQLIHDLWGIGFTIVKRPTREAQFDCLGALPPRGMVYQWCDTEALSRGWTPVRAYRHPGIFAPYGSTDDIAVDGLLLCERPRAEVQAFHDAAHVKARKNVDDWFGKVQADGFTGGVTVLSEGSNGHQTTDIREVGPKTLENVTKIPRDLQPHIVEIFAERDRLWEHASEWWGKDDRVEYQRYTELTAANPDWERGHTMNAVLTPIAIDNIRKKLATEGARHDQAANTEQPTGGDAGTDGSGGRAEAGAPAGGASPSN